MSTPTIERRPCKLCGTPIELHSLVGAPRTLALVRVDDVYVQTDDRAPVFRAAIKRSDIRLVDHAGFCTGNKERL